MRSNFVYDDLSLDRQQIRLVRFQQNADDGVIGDMRTFDLDSTPTYKALSYTWGPPTPLRPIILNDRRLELRHNLFLFLLKFAAPVAEGKPSDTTWSPWIWIDQSSINQESMAERNSQVQFMDTIYRSASEVIVWLGPDSDRGRAFVLAGEIGSCDDENQPAWLAFTEDDRKVWLRFLANSYWKRLWVVQEIILARKITLWHGDSTLPGNVFTRLCESKFGLANTTRLMKWIVQGRVHRYAGHAHADMFWALEATTASLCQDPRDKVYGLQSLFAAEHRVEVDYGKAVEDVYIEVVDRLVVATSGVAQAAVLEGLYFVARGMGLLRHVSLNTFTKVLEESDEEFYAVEGGVRDVITQPGAPDRERLLSRVRHCLRLDDRFGLLQPPTQPDGGEWSTGSTTPRRSTQ